MSGKQYSVATPIELESGKTIWVNVGRGFEGDGNNKYAVKISLSAIPLTMFKGEPIDLFLFDPEKAQQRKGTRSYRGPTNVPDSEDRDFGPLPGDEDVPF